MPCRFCGSLECPRVTGILPANVNRRIENPAYACPKVKIKIIPHASGGGTIEVSPPLYHEWTLKHDAPRGA